MRFIAASAVHAALWRLFLLPAGAIETVAYHATHFDDIFAMPFSLSFPDIKFAGKLGKEIDVSQMKGTSTGDWLEFRCI